MKVLLVPIDFSACSEHALVQAIDFADKVDAKVHLLHVIPMPTFGVVELGLAISSAAMTQLATTAQTSLDNIAAAHRATGRIAGVWVRSGDPRDVILEAAHDLGIDLIVMGTHGRRGLARAFLGSVVESVVRTAPCPVLMIRSPKRGEP